LSAADIQIKGVFLIGTTERQFPFTVVFDNILAKKTTRRAILGVDLVARRRRACQQAVSRLFAFQGLRNFSALLICCRPEIDEVARRPLSITCAYCLMTSRRICRVLSGVSLKDVCITYEFEDVFVLRRNQVSDDIIRDDRLAAIGSRAANALGYKNLKRCWKGCYRELFG